jgi:hypothetical protein
MYCSSGLDFNTFRCLDDTSIHWYKCWRTSRCLDEVCGLRLLTMPPSLLDSMPNSPLANSNHYTICCKGAAVHNLLFQLTEYSIKYKTKKRKKTHKYNQGYDNRAERNAHTWHPFASSSISVFSTTSPEYIKINYTSIIVKTYIISLNSIKIQQKIIQVRFVRHLASHACFLPLPVPGARIATSI